ncbi:MAG: hypothetical protein A2W01_03025 [Candidatus Solincola sediminis]|nr:MAG: hypothetical protein A2W01_03025 [Candidatus Solincola sediminis]
MKKHPIGIQFNVRTYFFRILLLLVIATLALGIILPFATRGAAVAQTNPATIADRFGIASSHLMTFDEQTMDRKFQAMDELQAGWVRSTMAWHDVEYLGKGQWTLQGCDMAVAKANQHGVKVLGILCGCPAWANGGKEAFYPPTEDHLEDWKTYVRTMATKYKGKVAAWEIWNEENIQYWQPTPDPVYYTRLLKLASTEIRAADPAATIVMGGTAPVDPGFLETTFHEGSLDYVDAIAYHPYPEIIGEAGQPPEAKYWPKEKLSGWILNGVRELIWQHTTKPIQVWITEMGYSTGAAEIDYQTQAAYMLRCLINYASTNVDRLIWYQLRDEPPVIPDEAGLMTYGFVKKTAFYYYANFKQLFGSATNEDLSQVSFSCSAPATLESHCFPLPDGRLMLSAWKSDNVADSLNLTITNPEFGSVMLVDPATGARTPASGLSRDSQGRITIQGLPIGKVPVILEVAKVSLTITSVSPNQVSQFTFWQDLSISGSGFGPGATVRLEKGSTVIDAFNVNVVSDGSITCTGGFWSVEAGAYDIVVNDGVGHEARLPGALTVGSGCGTGSGAGILALGVMLGVISLAGSFRLRRSKRK